MSTAAGGEPSIRQQPENEERHGETGEHTIEPGKEDSSELFQETIVAVSGQGERQKQADGNPDTEPRCNGRDIHQ